MTTRATWRHRSDERETTRHASQSANTGTTGARFGLISSATASAAAAPTADRIVVPSANQHASANAPATGTSVMFTKCISRNGGLAATSTAARRPSVRDPRRMPSRYVDSTSSAPPRGTTTKGPHEPPTNLPSAISSGIPGEYVGTIAHGSCVGPYPAYVNLVGGAGLKPSGANPHAAFGQGASLTHGCEIDTRPFSHNSAWLRYPYESDPPAAVDPCVKPTMKSASASAPARTCCRTPARQERSVDCQNAIACGRRRSIHATRVERPPARRNTAAARIAAINGRIGSCERTRSPSTVTDPPPCASSQIVHSAASDASTPLVRRIASRTRDVTTRRSSTVVIQHEGELRHQELAEGGIVLDHRKVSHARHDHQP